MSPTFLLPLFTALAPAALAQDAVRLEFTRKGLVEGPPPGLIVRALQPLPWVSIQVACGAASARHQGGLDAGDSLFLPIKAPLGAHRCSGELKIRLADDSEGSMPVSFDIEVLSQLSATVPPESLDLVVGSLLVQADRPLAGASGQIFGEHGELRRIDTVEAAEGGALLRWTPPAEEVLRIVITAVDELGFAARVELFPWSYQVPHEDLVFDSGKALLRSSEEPKLVDAWERIQAVEARYGAVATVNLYVAGFTDTVGDSAANLRLSADRARAIARWFRSRGFKGGIWFQGLGEQGLAVPTPDEVDEERNRRADYIVAAQPPPPSAQLPGNDWRRLD